MVPSPPTPVASTVVASGGPDVLLLPLSVHNDHLYHGPHQQDHINQFHDQRQLNSWNEASNNDPRLYSRFNYQGFKFVPAAYSLTPRKATLPGLPEYGFRTEVKTTQDILQEWRFGYKGRPAIQDLNKIYPSRWWGDQAQGEYEDRWMIVWEFVRLCEEKNLTSEEAVEVLEELRGDTGSLQKLVHAIRAQHFYGLTTSSRIQQAGLSTMAAEETGKDHSELVTQCDRTDLERNNGRSDPRLYHHPSEFEPDHNHAEYEPNHTRQDFELSDSRSGFELKPILPVLETSNNRAAPLPNQHVEVAHGPQSQSRTRKRKPVYRFESDTEDDDDYVVANKGKKARRKKHVKRKDPWSDTVVKKKRNSPKGSLEDDEQHPFPLPVRNNLAISDIWKEWTVGWEGEPSMESLIAFHGRTWVPMRRHHNHFTYRCRIVRVIHAGVRLGAVASEEEACAEIEKLRETPECTPINLTIKYQFKELVRKWGAEKVCREDIPVRRWGAEKVCREDIPFRRWGAEKVCREDIP